MTEPAKVYIAAVGMVTPLGADAEMTAAAVRAGISAYKESPFLLENDEPIRMALVPDELIESALDEQKLVGEFTARQLRLLQLTVLALGQLKSVLPEGSKIPLFLAGPEQLIDGDQPLSINLLGHLEKQTEIEIDLEMSRILANGRAGGPAAISMAFKYFASSDAKFVLVGAVDSYYDSDLLIKLFEEDRLLADNNPDGFIPGEAAVFMLLSKDKVVFNDSADAVAIFEPGLSLEKGHRYSEETYMGDGLATAVRTALENANTGRMKIMYASMNGEHLFAKEHGVAYIRNSNYFEDKMQVEHPADCYGDVGAACGLVMTGIVAEMKSKKGGKIPSLICCSSDKEPRSAMVVG